jgi:hypothetical protein
MTKIPSLQFLNSGEAGFDWPSVVSLRVGIGTLSPYFVKLSVF